MIVGIRGSIGAGKDTVARLLARDHGFARVGFADALKDVTIELLGDAVLIAHPLAALRAPSRADCDDLDMKKALLWGPAGPIETPSGRKLTLRAALEIVGTEVGRHVWADLWIQRAMVRARGLLRAGASGVAIPDLRFENEHDAVRRAGGEVWEVRRLGGPPEERTSHASDAAWRDLPRDRAILNQWDETGRLENLSRLVAEALRDARSGAGE